MSGLERAGAFELSDSEEEYDGATSSHARTSEEVRRHDQETLAAEEEAERLLGGTERSASMAQRFAEKRDARRQRRRAERQEKGSRRRGEKSELMYDMEGGRRSSSESSQEADRQRLKETQAKQTSRAGRLGRFAAIHAIIILAFLAILYGAYKASAGTETSRASANKAVAKTLSNGTHVFAPTTLLISLDGFRADFLARGLTPTLNSFIRSGVSPKFMKPSFPSLTFPNHFTLVTGLHPESHGIVGNTFWDPSTSKEFYYTDPDRSMHPEWWNAEPLWLTAELAGVRSAIHMWPGSEAHIGSVEPAYVDEFNADERLDRKVDRILHWLDRPGPEDVGSDVNSPRPQFIAAYVPDTDSQGHRFGPNSTEIRSTIKEVDGMLGTLFQGIDERNLTNIVNIIVVSDHGMATTSISRLIQLEDLVDTALIEHTDGWPLYGLRPYNHDPAHLQDLYASLVAKSKLKEYRNAFSVYLRDENMPAHYHFTANTRIAPLWIMPHTGWAIVTRDEFDVARGKQQKQVYKPRGLHGYDLEHPLMRAIFIARGPAFPHPQGSRVAEFQNIEVYNMVCDSLGIEPKPNNGTLRLPLQTNGKHHFDEDVEVPWDAQDDDEQPTMDNLNFGVPPVIPASLPPIMDEVEALSSTTTTTKTHGPAPTRPIVHDGLSPEEEEPKDFNRWWDWVKGKLDAIKWWASEAFDWKHQGAKNGTEEESGTNKSGHV